MTAVLISKAHCLCYVLIFTFFFFCMIQDTITARFILSTLELSLKKRKLKLLNS